VSERRGANIAAVALALANKNARVLCALLARNEDYRLQAAAYRERDVRGSAWPAARIVAAAERMRSASRGPLRRKGSYPNPRQRAVLLVWGQQAPSLRRTPWSETRPIV